jgi:hypothetical protein
MILAGFSPSCIFADSALDDDPEKWKPVFGKDHAEIGR